MANEKNETADTVTVGCKLPHGLHLDAGGKRATLNGVNSSGIIGGYGLTQVDRGLWEAWLADHRRDEMVTNGLVFAQDKEAKARDQAQEQSDVRSGMEPVDPLRPNPKVTPVDPVR